MVGHTVDSNLSEAVTRLLKAIPTKGSRPGLGNLKSILVEALPSIPLTLLESGNRIEITEAGWNRLWQKVLARYPSYDTRRRMRELLAEVAAAWQQAGLIDDIPEFDVPPQHRRRLTVAVDRLKGYRFSDYQRLVAWLVETLSGKGDHPILGLPAMPQSSTNVISPQFLWLTLLLILSGVCQHGPLKVISQIRWEDVLLTLTVEPAQRPGPVIRLPRRNGQGYTWLRLPKLAALFVYAAAHRARSLQGPLGQCDSLVWARAFRHFLNGLCELAGVPPIALTQLIYFVRLDLRQSLPNPNLAVLLGQLPFSPVPGDQMIELVYGKPVRVPANYHWRPNAGAIEAVEDMDEVIGLDGWNTEILSQYDGLLDGRLGLRSRFAQVLNESSSSAVREVQQRCDTLITADESGAVNVAQFNLGWTGRWLIDLVGDGALRPSTRKTYLASVCRLIRLCPETAVHQIDQTCLQALLSVSPRPTAKLTCSAWKRFWEFLKRSGLEATPIEWTQIAFTVDSTPRRVLTDADFTRIYSALSGPSQQVFWFNKATGLRVSEACRLKVSDVILKGEAHLLVTHSKGGRSRRVSLGHLSAKALKHLSEHHRKRLAVGSNAPFIVDGSGRALDPKWVSGEVGRQLAQAHLAEEHLEGLAPSLHSARKSNAEERYRQTGDVRHVSLELGHALPLTTIGWYLHRLDLEAIRQMECWPSPLNRSELHLPLATLAKILSVDRSRVRQMVSEFNLAISDPLIQAVRPNPDLPDGAGRCGPALRADYLSIADAFRLFQWLVGKRHKQLPTLAKDQGT